MMKLFPLFVSLLALTSCVKIERAPNVWMYEQFKIIKRVCASTGMVESGIKRISVRIDTWSCPYPADFDLWLKSFESTYLHPQRWEKLAKQKKPIETRWISYCNKDEPVVLRLVKSSGEKRAEANRLLISIQYPPKECGK